MTDENIENIETVEDVIDELTETYDSEITFEQLKAITPKDIEPKKIVQLFGHIGLINYEVNNGCIESIVIKEPDTERVKVRAENLFLLDESVRKQLYSWIENGKASPNDLEEDATLTTLIDQIEKAKNNDD